MSTKFVTVKILSTLSSAQQKLYEAFTSICVLLFLEPLQQYIYASFEV